AFENAPSACTVTTPFGWMKSRPLVAPHMSTGTYTFVAGQSLAGSVNATPELPAGALIAPVNVTIPSLSCFTPGCCVPYGPPVQPLTSWSAVSYGSVYACASAAPTATNDAASAAAVATCGSRRHKRPRCISLTLRMIPTLGRRVRRASPTTDSPSQGRAKVPHRIRRLRLRTGHESAQLLPG